MNKYVSVCFALLNIFIHDMITYYIMNVEQTSKNIVTYTDLVNLKFDVDKLDIEKNKNIPSGLSNLKSR